MRQVLVRYKVKADKALENEELIGRVFEELVAKSPDGMRYISFKQDDGVSFVHLASIEADQNPLAQLEAFKAFQAQIRDRCEEPPVAVDLHEIGSYRVFD